MARAGDEHKPSSVGIEAMGRTGLLRVVNLLEDVLERVAVETSAGMHGERRWLVEDDDRFVFVKDIDRGGDGWFGDGGEFLEIAFAGADDVIGSNWPTRTIKHETLSAKGNPFGSGDVLEGAIEKFQKSGAVAIGGDADGTKIIVRDAAGKR